MGSPGGELDPRSARPGPAATPRPGGPSGARGPRVVAVVPARLGSTRLARKLLRRDTGRYLFEHTVRNVERCASIARVVLATDADEVLAAAAEVGIEALATSADHPSGTDRVHEAHALLRARGEGPWDVVVNVQGDEPELAPDDLATLVAAFREPDVELATLAAPLADPREALDPSVVKVVCDARGDALYFSRAAIPCTAHARDASAAQGLARRHVGTYAFRPDALAAFCALPPGRLERAECLEQLRWLEAGRRLRVLAARGPSPGIDTEEHYAAFVARAAQQEHSLTSPGGTASDPNAISRP